MKVIIFFILLLSSFGVRAQFVDSIVPYRVGDKWGYSNYQGEILIQAQFDFAERFQLANKSEYKFKGRQDTILFAGVEIGGERFYIDVQGHRIRVKVKYFTCGFIACIEYGSFKESKGLYGFEYNDGFNIPAIYKDVIVLSKDLLVVRSQEGKYGLINREGETVLPFAYQKIEVPSDCYEGILTYKKDGLWGIYHVNTRRMIPPKYLLIYDFIGKIAYVRTSDKLWGCINREGYEYFQEP